MKRNDMIQQITLYLNNWFTSTTNTDGVASHVLDMLEDHGMIDESKWEAEDPTITITRSQFMRMASETLKEEFSSSRALIHHGPVTHGDVISILSRKIFGDFRD